MKKLTLILALLFALLAVGCGGEKEPNVKEPVTIAALNDRSAASSALAGTDALGREIRPAGEKKDKLVGLFYFLWLGNYYYDGQQMFSDIYDISKMDLDYVLSPGGSPFSRMHFWGEPLFGYYNMRDRWVVERHIRMFIAADIDFLAFDTTNNDYYPTVLDVVLDVLLDYQRQGYSVPKIMFLTNTDSSARVQEIYEYVYTKEEYRSLWFTDEDEGRNPERKTWITMNLNETAYLPQRVRTCFYFKESQWPNQPYLENGFPWIEFTRPQPAHGGVVSVSVAQNAGMHMSDSVQYKESPNEIDYYNRNWGRGYTEAGKNDPSKIAEGANFEEQWDNAIALDPHIVFVTGWNEWAALKLATAVEGIGNTVVFFDCFDREFSRDIEPVNGEDGDNFYMQLVRNIRRFKGTEGEGIAFAKQTVAAWSDWERVSSGVTEPTSGARDFTNAALNGSYSAAVPVNDIVELRAAEDEENLYFLVTAAEDLKACDDADFMTLYLKTGNADGYTCKIAGRDGKITFFSSDGGGSAAVVRSGRYLWFTVSKAAIGYRDGVEVKVVDHAAIERDILNAYTEGDAAPYGRLNYRFYG